MSELLARSAAYLDGDEAPGDTNPITLELAELTDDLAMVASFSHVVTLRTDDGLVLFDTSMTALADQALAALRSWTDDPVRTLVYTHGHLDHVGGAPRFVDEATTRGDRRPEVVAHTAVSERFARYDRTRGWQRAINERQFGGGRRGGGELLLFPERWVEPSISFDDQLSFEVGGVTVELHHDRGETDDHAWAWLPEQRALACGDLVAWVFPNAGNPQKVQRFPADWAVALRRMVALQPELLLPAHGLPVAGAARVRRLLEEQAEVLESLVTQTVDLMNDGAVLDQIRSVVRVPDHLTDRPHLQPIYDEPEFVVNNVWRQYGGWWDGDPSRLKPAPAADLAGELSTLAGGADVLAARAAELSEAGEHRLASHLAELAAQADPESTSVHTIRAAVYRARRHHERSLMSKGIFGSAETASKAVLEAGDAPAHDQEDDVR
jgi:alkyl sulfatase BDS1-like metallo-beta-lactamase superfamily hydrolase